MLYPSTVAAGFAAVLLTGAMAGIFFAFSVSVMPALDAIAPRAAIASMRAINRRIQNPVFFIAFFGAPVASLAAGILFLARGGSQPAAAMFAAGALYLLGALAPTIAINVPLNNRLDRAAEPADETAAAMLWREYSGPWTRANHLRAAFSMLSLLFCAIALFRHGWPQAMAS